MVGILIDIAAVIVGSGVGLLLKKGINEKVSKAVMVGIGLCIVYIGITGITSDGNTIVILLALVIGAFIGTTADIDGWLNRVGEKVENRLMKGEGDHKLAKGFVTMTLLSCVGAYAFIASVNAGLGNNEMMLTKAVIDFVVSMMLSSTLGIGVMVSAAAIFAYQTTLALLAGLISPLLLGNADMLDALSIVGAILTIPLGTNIMGVTDIKIVNYIPAIIVAPILAWIVTLIP